MFQHYKKADVDTDIGAMPVRTSLVEYGRNAGAGALGALVGGALSKALGNKDTSAAKGSLLGALGGVGLYQLRKAIMSGELTGRETLYHGTTKDKGDSIRENGFNAVSKNNIGVTARIPVKLRRASIGKSFSTSDRLKAEMYARTTAARKLRQIDPRDPDYWKKTWDAISDQDVLDDSDVVEFNAPTWAMPTVLNPEVNSSLTAFIKDKASQKNKRTQEELSTLRGLWKREHLADDKVLVGDIPSKYILGSKDYQPNSLSEFSEYVTNNPGNFLQGVLRAGLGIGGSALALKYLYDHLRKK